ncbi:MAG: flagellar basal body-associated FliL family protein [Synergistaceae bacterium]|nr:flagellar basal body-associated FliL family protein [Synergistaceae bacterium]
MKRLIIVIFLGLALFAAGIGGGILLGRELLNSSTDGTVDAKSFAAPGPIVPMGEFVVNLAGNGNRVASFSVSLEALNSKIDDTIKSQNWIPRIRSEILLIAKDKVYEDLTKAEGVVQFGEQIKRTLNTILPLAKGEAPIVRVMFETFVLQ